MYAFHGPTATSIVFRLIGAALFAVMIGQASANEQAPKKLEPGDVQAIFEVVISRMCEREVVPLLEKFAKDIDLKEVASDATAPKRICSCTARAASEGPRMKAVYERPAEQFKELSSDAETQRLLKGKVAAGLLQCTGIYLDRLVDPRPKSQ